MSQTLSHLDEKGQARMVDVTVKEPSLREATATGKVVMSPRTLALIQEGGMPKGDVFGVARIAGIMAAKKTGELIPMCHPLELTHVEIRFNVKPETGEVFIESQARLVGRTGVEMEALTAVSVAARIRFPCSAISGSFLVLGGRGLGVGHVECHVDAAVDAGPGGAPIQQIVLAWIQDADLVLGDVVFHELHLHGVGTPHSELLQLFGQIHGAGTPPQADSLCLLRLGRQLGNLLATQAIEHH